MHVARFGGQKQNGKEKKHSTTYLLAGLIISRKANKLLNNINLELLNFNIILNIHN